MDRRDLRSTWATLATLVVTAATLGVALPRAWSAPLGAAGAPLAEIRAAADATEVADRGATPPTTAPPTTAPPTSSPTTGSSLRFFGTGSGGVDRVRIPLTSTTAANIGTTSFTIEFWLKSPSGSNTAGVACSNGDAAWTGGHTIVDRDVFGDGDRGDFGISLMNGRIAFGVSRGSGGATVCGTSDLRDGSWHHVALTRDATSGLLRIFVDGAPQAQVTGTATTGDVSYRVGRSTSWPADPFLVIGAEKHDYAPEYPSFAGWIDDLRLSTGVRHTGTFARPSTPHPLDASTVALYRFDETSGTTVGDLAGTSPGERVVGGSGAGPAPSADIPFTG
jgi:hypothetical protein